ncbi:DUF5707 domain-containing protein [Streptomyces sp. NPDC058751]|uniref:DUF5707 domain-containing protein n=1 Tax=Streptomyces sp. NPDC058751 TaxID=3346623 RepID=UPI0036BFCC2C
MRMRAFMALSGAAVVAGSLVVPAAHAAPAETRPTITKVRINDGDDIVIGTTAVKTVKVTVTASHPSGIKSVGSWLYHGDFDAPNGGDLPEGPATCTAVNATTSTCTQTYKIDPTYQLKNSMAGSWHAGVVVLAKDDSYTTKENAALTYVKRATNLTVNASPEPVTRGRYITVTGKLTRANWETHTYKPYQSQSVKLQFRKRTADTYASAGTSYTNAQGDLQEVVVAGEDGYWRWKYNTNSTTAAKVAVGDYVDVR